MQELQIPEVASKEVHPVPGQLLLAHPQTGGGVVVVWQLLPMHPAAFMHPQGFVAWFFHAQAQGGG